MTSRRADLPPAVDQLFARALAKTPVERYPSCQQFADALLHALGAAPHHLGPQAVEDPAPDHPPTQIGRVDAQATDQQRLPAVSAAAGTVSPPFGGADTPTTDADIPAPLARDTGGSVPDLTRRVQREAQIRVTRRPWTRDWTAWVLILALPVLIFGVVGLNRAMGSVGYGIGGTLVILTFLGVPVALIAKLFRWWRRRHGHATRADSQ